jgi:hypothetical protein
MLRRSGGEGWGGYGPQTGRNAIEEEEEEEIWMKERIKSNYA